MARPANRTSRGTSVKVGELQTMQKQAFPRAIGRAAPRSMQEIIEQRSAEELYEEFRERNRQAALASQGLGDAARELGSAGAGAATAGLASSLGITAGAALPIIRGITSTANAPSGYGLQGLMHGVGRGAASGVGLAGGATLGSLLGALIAHGSKMSPNATIATTAAGGLGGGGFGALVGEGLAEAVLGPHPSRKDKEDREREESRYNELYGETKEAESKAKSRPRGLARLSEDDLTGVKDRRKKKKEESTKEANLGSMVGSAVWELGSQAGKQMFGQRGQQAPPGGQAGAGGAKPPAGAGGVRPPAGAGGAKPPAKPDPWAQEFSNRFSGAANNAPSQTDPTLQQWQANGQKAIEQAQQGGAEATPPAQQQPAANQPGRSQASLFGDLAGEMTFKNFQENPQLFNQMMQYNQLMRQIQMQQMEDMMLRAQLGHRMVQGGYMSPDYWDQYAQQTGIEGFAGRPEAPQAPTPERSRYAGLQEVYRMAGGDRKRLQQLQQDPFVMELIEDGSPEAKAILQQHMKMYYPEQQKSWFNFFG